MAEVGNRDGKGERELVVQRERKANEETRERETKWRETVSRGVEGG